MAKDLSQTKWHGVPRQDILWFPQVNPETCIGYELCFVTCGREVYEIELQADGKHRKAVAERPYNCMVGCSTCSMVCPTQAITFPGRDVVWEVEKQYKIFGTVRKEARPNENRPPHLRRRHNRKNRPKRPLSPGCRSKLLDALAKNNSS